MTEPFYEQVRIQARIILAAWLKINHHFNVAGILCICWAKFVTLYFNCSDGKIFHLHYNLFLLLFLKRYQAKVITLEKFVYYFER